MKEKDPLIYIPHDRERIMVGVIDCLRCHLLANVYCDIMQYDSIFL